MRILRFGILALVLLIPTGLLIVSLGDRTREGEFLPAGEIAMGDVSQKVWNVRLSSLQRGIETLHLDAETAEIRNHGKDLSLQQIRITWVQDGGLPLTVEGESGVLNLDARSLLLRGGVKPVEISLGSRYRMQTPSLEWDETAREVRTTEKVVFEGEGAVIEGIGFVGDLERGIYEVQQPVRAKLDL